MKVGDLVKYRDERVEDVDALGLGIVLGFDADDDPLIHFYLDTTPTNGGDAFF